MTLTDALRLAETDKDEWHAEHQGPLVDIIAEVWWCGDEWCNCTQAQIVARFRNLFDSRWIVPVRIWSGEFYTDGDVSGATDELSAKQAEVLSTEPEMAARITWPVPNA